MSVPWPRGLQQRAAWGAVAFAAALAAGSHWLERWRLSPPDRSASVTFRVTSSADSGPGSLRDAILVADRVQKRARITVAVRQIALETGLPPLVNPFGVILEAADGVEIDGTLVQGPVLDIASPGTSVSGIQIVGGGAGVVVRAPGATFRNVTVRRSDTAILIGEGSDAVHISESAFDSNRIGIQLAAPTGEVSLQRVRFRDHRLAAVWAVSAAATAHPPSIQIADSRFLRDFAGLVAINVAARVERNRFDDAQTTAVHASGGRAFIEGNQMQAGKGFGIYAEHLESGQISGNEIARNCSSGILLRDAGNTRVISNEVYQNAYGIVMMEGPSISPNLVADNLIADQVGDGLMLIGASPIVSRNQVLRNRQAGLRLSSLTLESGRTRTPSPLLEDNVVRDNGSDETERDQYQSGASDDQAPASDCRWRTGTPSFAPVRASQQP